MSVQKEETVWLAAEYTDKVSCYFTVKCVIR